MQVLRIGLVGAGGMGKVHIANYAHIDGCRIEHDAKGRASGVVYADAQGNIYDDPDLLMDLRRVRRRTTQAGVTIDLVSTPDGRHCDYAPALALAIGRRAGMAPDAPEDTTEEESDPYLQAELAQADRPWWR